MVMSKCTNAAGQRIAKAARLPLFAACASAANDVDIRIVDVSHAAHLLAHVLQAFGEENCSPQLQHTVFLAASRSSTCHKVGCRSQQRWSRLKSLLSILRYVIHKPLLPANTRSKHHRLRTTMLQIGPALLDPSDLQPYPRGLVKWLCTLRQLRFKRP